MLWFLCKIQMKQEHVEGKYMAEYYRSPVSLESPETKWNNFFTSLFINNISDVKKCFIFIELRSYLMLIRHCQKLHFGISERGRKNIKTKRLLMLVDIKYLSMILSFRILMRSILLYKYGIPEIVQNCIDSKGTCLELMHVLKNSCS